MEAHSGLDTIWNSASTAIPMTPDPPHASLPGKTQVALNKSDSTSSDAGVMADAADRTTEDASVAVKPKSRTPTPTISHVSTPPPTIENGDQIRDRYDGVGFSDTVTAVQIANMGIEDLRARVLGLQAAVQEAKMSAAHYKLQYQMLSQESVAAIERIMVEASMAQSENNIIHAAIQAKAAAVPISPPPSLKEGMIPVQKDLYHSMCREIQQLKETQGVMIAEQSQKEKAVRRQETEIASLKDKVTLMKDRIRENREHINRYRNKSSGSLFGEYDASAVATPLRSEIGGREQTQPFAALLQASEMASQEARRPAGVRKGHTRNIHSMSSLPTTPQRTQKDTSRFRTPQGRQIKQVVPATAPAPRLRTMPTPDVYSNSVLPMSHVPKAPLSDGTVSASDDEDYDSEAETDIIERDHEVAESQASRAASLMLKPSFRQEVPGRNGNPDKAASGQMGDGRLRQTTLFGAVRKANLERHADGEPPTKRARVLEPVGLGIEGFRD